MSRETSQEGVIAGETAPNGAGLQWPSVPEEPGSLLTGSGVRVLLFLFVDNAEGLNII